MTKQQIGELAIAVEHRRRAQQALENSGAKVELREARRQLSQAEQDLAAAVAASIEEDRQ